MLDAEGRSGAPALAKLTPSEFSECESCRLTQPGAPADAMGTRDHTETSGGQGPWHEGQGTGSVGKGAGEER